MENNLTQLDFETEFEKLNSAKLRAMTTAFLETYEMPKTKFARRVNLSPGIVNRWLTDEEPLSVRSLKRIFEFMAEYFPRWRDFCN